jgi:hypothetical protein
MCYRERDQQRVGHGAEEKVIPSRACGCQPQLTSPVCRVLAVAHETCECAPSAVSSAPSLFEMAGSDVI